MREGFLETGEGRMCHSIVLHAHGIDLPLLRIQSISAAKNEGIKAFSSIQELVRRYDRNGTIRPIARGYG